MKRASVSFVIPVHNGARYLRESIESALNQTVAPSEVIVVDDGSEDESAAVAESFGYPVRCARIRHAGQAAARNHGVSIASGDFIAFLDADDIAVPHRIERQLARFEARPELDFCEAYTQNFWSPEIPVAERRAAPQEGFTHGDVPKPYLIITWLFRRRLFLQLGAFDEQRRFGEDTDWRDRVIGAKAVVEIVEEVLALRRLHHDNLTRRHYDQHLKAIVRHTWDRVLQARRNRGQEH
jgi:glycosyltransferase involved in cell wall biosynthesis